MPAEPPSAADHQTDEILVLDEDTQADLQLFSSDGADESLFGFCNRCSTDGGKRVLRRRMEAPWCTASRIKATQDAISFILNQREAFSGLPSAYVVTQIDRYLRASLPVVRQTGVVRFAVSAFTLWFNQDSFYVKIIRGVRVTFQGLKTLGDFADQFEATAPEGELGELVAELHSLLNHPTLARIRKNGPGRRLWSRLRADQAFRMWEKAAIERLLQLTYELDALVAMADTVGEHDLVLPTIDTGAVSLQAEGLVHPFLTDPVANPLHMDQSRRVLFLTGPNMAGKTTYLRAAATAVYLAHLGMGVPANSFRFVPAQRLVTSISVSDNLNGVSYFRAEALRVKAVAKAVADGYRVVAIMDEPFKGTNVKDAFDASLAILQRFATSRDCLFVVSSHLIELSEQLSDAPQVSYRYFEAQEQTDRLRFDYVLHEGVSDQRLGMRVLSEEGVFDLLDGNQR